MMKIDPMSTAFLSRLCLCCLCCLLGAGLPAAAQLAVMERSPGHERLDFLVGRWTHEEPQTILGEEHTVSSEAEYDWQPGGVWLVGGAVIRGLPGIEEHRGWLHVTYDLRADEVVHLWYDNQSAILFVSRGQWDNDRLVLEGSHEWDGKTQFRRVVYIPIAADEYTREFLVSDDGEHYVSRSLATHRRAN